MTRERRPLKTGWQAEANEGKLTVAKARATLGRKRKRLWSGEGKGKENVEIHAPSHRRRVVCVLKIV